MSSINVVQRKVDIFSLVFWFISLITIYLAFPFATTKQVKNRLPSRAKVYFFVFAIIAIALVVRTASIPYTMTFHTDEYLSADFSYEIGDLTKVDWFGVYPPKGDWVCQFPLPYFFFQKLFFNIFGVGTLPMRLSILPYNFLVFLFLFLVAKRLYNEEVGILSIALLALF